MVPNGADERTYGTTMMSDWPHWSNDKLDDDGDGDDDSHDVD